jgi:hypothetical protein
MEGIWATLDDLDVEDKATMVQTTGNEDKTAASNNTGEEITTTTSEPTGKNVNSPPSEPPRENGTPTTEKGGKTSNTITLPKTTDPLDDSRKAVDSRVYMTDGNSVEYRLLSRGDWHVVLRCFTVSQESDRLLSEEVTKFINAWVKIDVSMEQVLDAKETSHCSLIDLKYGRNAHGWWSMDAIGSKDLGHFLKPMNREKLRQEMKKRGIFVCPSRKAVEKAEMSLPHDFTKTERDSTETQRPKRQ